MSRPALSVPKTCGQDGGFSILAKSTKLPAEAGKGAITGASRAIRITRMVMAKPTTAVGLRAKRYQPRRQPWPARAGRAGRGSSSEAADANASISGRAFQADARVQIAAQHIHGQVGDGEHQPHDQHHADDGVEVLLQHGAHAVAGHARPAE